MSIRILVPLLIVSLHCHETAFTQEPSAANGSPNRRGTSTEQPAPDRPKQLTDEQKEQKRQLEIGMILVGGILILGVFLLAMTLLVSRRLKRNIAEGRQPSRPRDELWYLKNSAHGPASDDEEPPA